MSIICHSQIFHHGTVTLIADGRDGFFKELQSLLEECNSKVMFFEDIAFYCRYTKESGYKGSDLVLSSVKEFAKLSIDMVDEGRECFKSSKIVLFFDDECIESIDHLKGFHISSFFPKDIGHHYFFSIFEELMEGVRNHLSGKQNKEMLLKHLSYERPSSLMLLDIDNLDYFNNSYGYEFGDSIIVECANLLEDHKPIGSRLYHVWGDIFAILIDGENINLARDFAVIINVLAGENHINVKDIELSIAFTIGASSGRGEELLVQAQQALKNAKHKGKRHFYIYDALTQNVQNKNIEWMKRVKAALETNNVLPWYQPILDNATCKIESFECLARLAEREDTFDPEFFLEPARMIGFMQNISYSIINKSFARFQNCSDRFFINVSNDDFRSERFIKYLENRLKFYKIDPSRVTLEILESVGRGGDSFVKEQLMELKSMGLKLAIDDFGVESSNFSRMFEMEIDYVKIDGSFIRNIDKDEKSYKVVKSVVSFAHSIGAKTIAEFVHSKEVFDVVRGLGVEYSQGYYIAKPGSDLVYTPLFDLGA